MFLDAQHFDECAIADLAAVRAFMSTERYVIFIHDAHLFSKVFLRFVGTEFLPDKFVRLPKYAEPAGSNMAVITDIVDTELLV